MSVLVDGFTVVARLEAIRALYGGDWEAFRAELPNDSYCRDAHLVRVGFRTRPEFRAWLRVLWERDLKDAFRILHWTELSPRPLTAEEVARLQIRLARTENVALVYRRQPRRPEWVVVEHGRVPGTDVAIAGAFLAAAGRSGLAVPRGWRPEQAVPLEEEPDAGDEFLPTWHEYVAAGADPERKKYLLSCGPDAVLAYAEALGAPKPFGGRIHVGGAAAAAPAESRDLDATDPALLSRWLKLPS